MGSRSRWALALTLTLAAGSMASAQIIPGGGGGGSNGGLGNGNTRDDTGKVFQFAIKRKSVSGTIKSVDSDKKWVVLAVKQKEMPIDVGPSIIRAGKGKATFEDMKVGDKISVYGESTVQGGLRAMEITLPKERMSIPPKKQVPLTKEEKAAIKEAKDAEREKAKTARAEAEAARKAKKQKEKEEKEAEKREAAEEKSKKKSDDSDKDKEKDKSESSDEKK